MKHGAFAIGVAACVALVAGCGSKHSPAVPDGGHATADGPVDAMPDAGVAATCTSGAICLELLAGSYGGSGNLDGTGMAARFSGPQGIAVGSGGNVYVADTSNYTIREMTPTAIVTTIYPGTPALNEPVGVAADSAGNVYFADTAQGLIRKMTPAGVVTLLAGNSTWGSADGTGSAAEFFMPSGIALDSAGNLYVADTFNSTIRKVTPAGVVTTFAGSAGQTGSADGTGAAASFKFPMDVAVDSAGNVYVADTSNSTIRKITPAGVVTTLAGTAASVGSADGTGSAATFNGPHGLAVDSGGNVYVADSSNALIRKITPAAVVTTIAGGGGLGSADGTGSAARFAGPAAVAVDSSDNLYVADGDMIRKIDTNAAVTTFAGMEGVTGAADGTGAAAQFDGPLGIAVDGSGDVYVADFFNSTIRAVTPAGVVTTLAGSVMMVGSANGTGSAALFYQARGVAADGSGNVYVADTGNDTIRMITPAGVVTTFAGSAGVGGDTDGSAAAARFAGPVGLAISNAGTIYVGDGANTIREISAGVVSTLAGSGGTMGSADGTGSAARFDSPQAVAVDGSGTVYVADTLNNAIRKVTSAGVVTTLPSPTPAYHQPTGVAVDAHGNVYVADTFNSTIRMITPAGVITTVAGATGEQGVLLGAQPRLWQPVSVAVSGHALVISDANAILLLENVVP